MYYTLSTLFNVSSCPKCHAGMARNYSYCPICGAKKERGSTIPYIPYQSNLADQRYIKFYLYFSCEEHWMNDTLNPEEFHAVCCPYCGSDNFQEDETFIFDSQINTGDDIMQMSDIIHNASTPLLPCSHTNEELYRNQTTLLQTFLTHGAITPAQYKTSLQNLNIRRKKHA